jgi:hypothetical protein
VASALLYIVEDEKRCLLAPVGLYRVHLRAEESCVLISVAIVLCKVHYRI